MKSKKTKPAAPKAPEMPIEHPDAANEREVVILAPKPITTSTIKKRIRSIAEAHAGLKDGEIRSHQDVLLGTVEITGTGHGHLMLGLIDHGYRTFMFDLSSMKIVSDSEEQTTLAMPEKVDSKPKKSKDKPEPDMVLQKGYKGEDEWVDRNHYKHEVVCECGNIRYVGSSDVRFVTRCKPCQRGLVRQKNKDKVTARRRDREEEYKTDAYERVRDVIDVAREDFANDPKGLYKILVKMGSILYTESRKVK